jgi:hypothetical protein
VAGLASPRPLDGSTPIAAIPPRFRSTGGGDSVNGFVTRRPAGPLPVASAINRAVLSDAGASEGLSSKTIDRLSHDPRTQSSLAKDTARSFGSRGR